MKFVSQVDFELLRPKAIRFNPIHLFCGYCEVGVQGVFNTRIYGHSGAPQGGRLQRLDSGPIHDGFANTIPPFQLPLSLDDPI